MKWISSDSMTPLLPLYSCTFVATLLILCNVVKSEISVHKQHKESRSCVEPVLLVLFTHPIRPLKAENPFEFCSSR